MPKLHTLVTADYTIYCMPENWTVNPVLAPLTRPLTFLGVSPVVKRMPLEIALATYDYFQHEPLWHMRRAGERLINVHHTEQTGRKGGYTIENIAAFRAEVSAAIAALDMEGF